ncbi:thioredoxin family protein [Flavobacterium chuncheonense]|uniref:Thioredoxin family protein n=1 Tax=Flavobacterium chuncheonense TaxID=2026653 RepID=A0ABW5YNQ8_9FLAO
MEKILAQAFKNSLSYSQYRDLVSTLISEGKSTGNTQSEALLNYSELNETRMNRLEKTIQITDEVKSQLQSLQRNVTWLLLSEGWCGDAAQLVPIIHKMAEVSDKIDLKIVLRDENDALMNEFLTNGARAIPKLIMIDSVTNEVIGDWGPRPEPARKLIADYKATHGVVDEPAKIELQKWYLHDKGITTQNEIATLISEKVLV